jgi:hypothetical protein
MARKLKEFAKTGYWSFWAVPLTDIPTARSGRPIFGEHFETLAHLADENPHEPGLPFDTAPLVRQTLYLCVEDVGEPFLAITEATDTHAVMAAWIPAHSRDAVARMLVPRAPKYKA